MNRSYVSQWDLQLIESFTQYVAVKKYGWFCDIFLEEQVYYPFRLISIAYQKVLQYTVASVRV